MTTKIHHRSATPANHFGRDPQGMRTKRHESVTCGHCKANRKKARARV